MMQPFRSFRHLAALALIASTAILLLPSPAPVQARSKSSVKAAMVYNIARFIKFPGNPDRLRFCALARDPIARDMRALNGRIIGRSRIEVRLLGSTSQIGSSCNVVYLETASPRSVGRPSRGQVLIGSGRNFAGKGGTVGLISFGGQVRFVVNDGAAKRAGVRFSAQLLQLAARVIT